MITLSAVSKSYDHQPKVLDAIQLELKRGDFLYVAGGSGAGKSSLLRILATEEAPTSGKVNLFGFDLGSVSPNTLCSIRQSVGYVPQSVRLIPDLSVYDNLALAYKISKSARREKKPRILDLLERVGLGAKRNRPAGLLSGGEAQKVSVVRALIREPDLIVADEPTGAQDRDSTWILMDLLIKANQAGSTVIVATHDREIVRRVRKRCAVLREGQLLIEDFGTCTF